MMRQASVRWLSPAGFFTMRWWEWGPPDGAPVVCVHGLTRTGRDFDPLAAVLAQAGRRVICPDLPGRGASDWLPDPMLYQPPVYVTALAHLLAGIEEPVDWVGTSLGGICGMGIAATQGHPIRRMVLNDIGAFVPQAAMARIREYIGQRRVFADMAALEAHLREVHAPFGALTDAQWRHLAETSARAEPGGGFVLHYDPAIAAPIRSQQPQPLDLRAYWARVEVPVLLIRGARSDLLSAETAAEMAEQPHVRLAEIADAGHAPALMELEQIALVQDFLKPPR